MDERARRLGENEALFREVNERIEEAAAKHGNDEHAYTYLCECSRESCDARVTLTRAEYARVRTNPRRFVLVRGHEEAGIEDVVEEIGSVVVVEKRGEAARAAERNSGAQ